MEEMSKKTKRLEKENQTLTRKQEATKQNILQMAEERTQTAKEVELLRKKNENLEKLCRGMQAQGRGQALMPQQGDEEPGDEEEQEDEDEDEDGTESEYDEEYDADASIEEYDEESEEEVVEPPKRPFGPVPPPKNQMPNGIVGGPSLQVIGPANGIIA
jgi:hypothetical protein